MSHFVVGVILPPTAANNVTEELECRLEPYCEGLEVEGHKEYLSENEIEIVRIWLGVQDLSPDKCKKYEEEFTNWQQDTALYDRAMDQMMHKKFIEKHGRLLTDKELVSRVAEYYNVAESGQDDNGIYYMSTYNLNSKWDWYQIGGRWQGMLGRENPKDNPVNYETCDICGGSGMRNDKIGKKMRVEDPEYTCNSCDGKGEKLKWPTDWEDTGGNITPIHSAIKLMEEDDSISFFALLTDEQKWLEKGRMGWFACVNYEDDLSPNQDDYETDDEWREAFKAFEDKKRDEWRIEVIEELKKYPDDYLIVVVDCHI